MILNTSLTLGMEIVFPGGGGSGRSPFESADPVRRVGRWKNRSTVVRSLKYSTVETVMGEGGRGAKEIAACRSPIILGLFM